MSKEWFLMMKMEVKMKMKETPWNLEYVTVGSELTCHSRNPFSCCWKFGTNEDDIH